MNDDRITIMLDKENSKGLRCAQSEALKNSLKSISFSKVITETAIEGIKHKRNWLSNLEDKNNYGDRITIVLKTEVTKDLRHIQAKATKDFQKSISFSRVLNEAIQEGLKHKRNWFPNLLPKKN